MATTARGQADFSAENERLRARSEAVERERAEALIEIGRLREELGAGQQRERAVADVLRAMGRGPEADGRVMEAIAEHACRLCGADNATVYRVVSSDEVAGPLRHLLDDLNASQRRGLPPEQPADSAQWIVPAASFAPSEDDDNWSAALFPLERDGRPFRGAVAPRAVVDAATVHVRDAAHLTDADGMPFAAALYQSTGYRIFLAVPLLHDGAAVGALFIRRREPRAFSEAEVALVETFAAQAAVATAQARLMQELGESNRTLHEALEQQTATAEILRAIASSPTDVQAVLGTIRESVVRLVDAPSANIQRVDGDDLVVEGTHHRLGNTEAPTTRTGTLRRTPIARTGPSGRAVLEKRTIHIHDVAALAPEDGYSREWIELQSIQFGYLTFLATPLLREDTALGVLVVRRRDVRPFTERQVTLVETFARQAVIAIENARLFSELEERDDRRRQELERASAIQQRLLPERVEGWPGVLEVAVRFRAAVETSGDFYDVLALTPARAGEPAPLQIAVGDVAGKGMAAALVTALARSALHATASVPTRMAVPSATLREAGARLHRDVGSTHFVACALAVVEPPSLLSEGPRIRLSNAAQVPVLLVRDGVAAELEAVGDRLPLGARPDGDYKDVEADLRAGDVIVFSSDGLVEAPARSAAAAAGHLAAAQSAGELFGFERLSHSAVHWASHAPTAEAVAAGMWGDLSAWCGEESHHDDMTLLVLRVPDAP